MSSSSSSSSQGTKPPPTRGKSLAPPGTPEGLPTVMYAVDGCVLGYWQRICIGVWAIPATLELVQQHEAVTKLLCEEAGRFSGVHLVIKRAPLPAAEVREAYQALTRRYAPNTTCVAMLIEGDGFWASAVRAFLTGVVMLDRRLRTKTFADLGELSAWVAQTHNAESAQPVTAEQLSLALEWMLQHPDVRAHRVGVRAGRERALKRQE